MSQSRLNIWTTVFSLLIVCAFALQLVSPIPPLPHLIHWYDVLSVENWLEHWDIIDACSNTAYGAYVICTGAADPNITTVGGTSTVSTTYTATAGHQLLIATTGCGWTTGAGCDFAGGVSITPSAIGCSDTFYASPNSPILYDSSMQFTYMWEVPSDCGSTGITLTVSSGYAIYVVVTEIELTGLVSGNPWDTDSGVGCGTSCTGGPVTSFSIPEGTSTNANDLASCVITNSGAQGVTPGGSYAAMVNPASGGNAGAGAILALALTSTGSQSCPATMTSPTYWQGMGGTLKLNTSGVTPVARRR